MIKQYKTREPKVRFFKDIGDCSGVYMKVRDSLPKAIKIVLFNVLGTTIVRITTLNIYPIKVVIPKSKFRENVFKTVLNILGYTARILLSHLLFLRSRDSHEVHGKVPAD
jgi:hypothetical protein